jgi:hypothetical protein
MRDLGSWIPQLIVVGGQNPSTQPDPVHAMALVMHVGCSGPALCGWEAILSWRVDAYHQTGQLQVMKPITVHFSLRLRLCSASRLRSKVVCAVSAPQPWRLDPSPCIHGSFRSAQHSTSRLWQGQSRCREELRRIRRKFAMHVAKGTTLLPETTCIQRCRPCRYCRIGHLFVHNNFPAILAPSTDTTVVPTSRTSTRTPRVVLHQQA